MNNITIKEINNYDHQMYCITKWYINKTNNDNEYCFLRFDKSNSGNMNLIVTIDRKYTNNEYDILFLQKSKDQNNSIFFKDSTLHYIKKLFDEWLKDYNNNMNNNTESGYTVVYGNNITLHEMTMPRIIMRLKDKIYQLEKEIKEHYELLNWLNESENKSGELK